MAEALRLAALGRWTTHPNPRVGCVIVRNDCIVGRGYHIQAGEGHAEVNAIRDAGEGARGATAYISMEPCSFEGRTPACTGALIEAGVSRVVAGMMDPDPRVAGNGFRILEQAGIQVTWPVMEASAMALNPGFIKRNRSGLPWVRIKLAMTLDGKTALANGDSKWITGPEARRDVQRLRAASSAIVTGVRTVIDDDPALTVRPEELDVPHGDLAARIRRPVVVLDPGLRIPREAKILANPDVILACRDDVGRKSETAELLPLPATSTGRLDLEALLRELAARECNEVLFECGATLAGAVVASGLADEIILYAAPRLMGAGAQSLLALPAIDSMR
ncbi:MAG: bifunctional diaminohydroxyphosphoribosylaminopyrimidine deaminase/5-amino-6-(5-phosphoribosylamino)uracil reductase RibD, partial [Pseudomonadales bacterium]|nr:bifunctional diaminohydroxyphosphoribosylaminopyrimidine deaminase/5-amino-6-(5-phosphoribosylamino)uracil reductase RibD [Pseudomonadales bacterium]